MRKIYFLVVCLFISGYIYAQLSEGGTPRSIQIQQFKSAQAYTTYSLKKINAEKLIKEDLKQKITNRYSIYKNVDIDIKQKGTATKVSDGTIWQYSVVAENGYSLGIFFKKYKLPHGATLFIYNPNYSIIYGAFTSKNNKEYGTFTVADFPGQTIIIEYFEPNNPEYSGELVLGKIGQSYKDIHGLSLKSAQVNEQIDINCPEGDLVQLEKHAVAKMTFEESNAGYLCTGALINNTNNDGKPYFLTARHCISTSAVASTLVTYFNFENKDCNGISFAGQNLSGSTLKASYKPSDFTLLLLTETPTSVYQPYYAGWNAESDSLVISGTGIHHPAGVEKKVSIEQDHILSYPVITTWEGSSTSPANTHWRIVFDKGLTEGGSSGSPLFDDKNRIVGQLHGGSDEYDLYGKLNYSWDKNSLPSAQLKNWLDPSATGVKILDGYYPLNNMPDAHFTSKFLTVCAGEPVYLEDGSLFSPTNWTWSFIPSTVDFLEGTNSHSQNPVVSFQDNTNYDITLQVIKGINNNSQTRRDYISAGDTLDLSIRAQNTGDLCFNNFTSTTLYGLGADSGSWKILSKINYLLIDSAKSNKDSLVLIKNDTIVIDTSYLVKVQFTGFHGKCADSVTIDLNVVYPFNDNIENALTITLGQHGPFTNLCASTQKNEPNPPSGDCNTQSNWCQCEISDNILDNSVWFKFTAPASGIVAIDALGFDDQIALYEAESAADILSDNTSLYKIIAANDDYYTAVDNYAALITNATVVPGKTYWIQVDGSGCGTDGTFTLKLYDRRYDPYVKIDEQELSFPSTLNLFPNPATDYVTIQKEDLTGKVIVSITTIDGKKIYESTSQSITEGEIRINLPDSMPDGLYVVTVTDGKTTYNNKLSVQR